LPRDGRHSLVRERRRPEVEEIGAPMDVLWFRAGKREGENVKTCLHGSTPAR
jgi:hypothetical protein